MGDTMTTPTDRPGGDAGPSEGRRRGTDLATAGFAMAATGPLLLLLATLFWGLDGGDTAFFVAPIVAAGIGIALVRREGTVPRVIAVVLALLIGAMLFWTAFGLAAPASFFDFVPGVLVLPGALLALAAGITSIRARRHQRLAGAGERRAVRIIVSAVALLAAVSAVLTVTGKDTLTDEQRESADVVVELSDFEFDEDAYDLSAGDTILVRNNDPLLHTFTVDALDIDETLNPGSEVLVTLPEAPGTYVLYCEPHTSDKEEPSDDDMAARLSIG